MNNLNQYAAFLEKRKMLSDILDRSSSVIHDLNMEQFGDNLKRLSGKVDADTFKIQVVGTFKNGKSTFINSLLGEYVLPAYSVPTTAVINEVKYGEEKRAVLYFRDPLPAQLPQSIPAKALSHINAHQGQHVPPLEISYEEIEDYVVIPMDADVNEMLLESPYEKVELFWPLPILQHGVEIIDSPGLNEAETRTKVTMDYLAKADAILFVLNAQQACSQQEMDFIQNNLKEQGFEDPFFVVNRWDCIPDREKPRMEKFVSMKVAQYSTNQIYYVSSLMALEAKEQGDTAKYQQSGVAEFEQRLSDFLTRQKGKAKLSQPARELKRILTTEALFKVIPQQRQMLSLSLNDLKARYEAVKPRLTTLRMEKEQLISKLMLRIEQSKTEFKRAMLKNASTLADAIPAWVEDYTPALKFGMIPSQSRAEAIAKDISNHVKDMVEKSQQEWQKEVMTPIIEERMKFIFDSAEADLKKLYSEIDHVNFEIAGTEAGNPDDIPVWQRVAGVAGGLLIGDIGAAFSGGVNGLSMELAKTLAFEFGAGIVLGILGILNPIIILGIVFAGGWWNAMKASENAMKKLKAKLSEDMVAQISTAAEANAEKQAANIVEKCKEAASLISGAVDTEIQETEQQVESIIADMEKGKATMAAREQVIARSEEVIKQLNTELDGLIFQLIEE